MPPLRPREEYKDAGYEAKRAELDAVKAALHVELQAVADICTMIPTKDKSSAVETFSQRFYYKLPGEESGQDEATYRAVFIREIKSTIPGQNGQPERKLRNTELYTQAVSETDTGFTVTGPRTLGFATGSDGYPTRQGMPLVDSFTLQTEEQYLADVAETLQLMREQIDGTGASAEAEVTAVSQ